MIIVIIINNNIAQCIMDGKTTYKNTKDAAVINSSI